ncbi:transposase [Vibrio vulnificus MO6-24/O]|nr:transposase [Vibrio vulnificus MO6-24/O]ALM73343.1 Mobile element protein [Vibrio vulnificus]ANH65704.1 Mobile element protein [Vibrio vulnificus]
MPKPRYKTTNWKQYNKALINRGSLTFWIDEEAIREWKQSKQKSVEDLVSLATWRSQLR